MALSDEDYGILYNAIAATPHGYGTHYATTEAKYHVIDVLASKIPRPILHNQTLQYLLDFAAFIILSEGRELP